MGLFKGMKDMKDMAAAAPGLIESAQKMAEQAQAQAAASAAAMQQSGGQGYVDAANVAAHGEPSTEALREGDRCHSLACLL